MGLQVLVTHKRRSTASPVENDGLSKYQRADYHGAIHDLEFAVSKGLVAQEVLFALGHSHFMLGELDQAAQYFKQVTGAGPYDPDDVTNAIGPNAPNGTPDYNYDIMGGLDARFDVRDPSFVDISDVAGGAGSLHI